MEQTQSELERSEESGRSRKTAEWRDEKKKVQLKEIHRFAKQKGTIYIGAKYLLKIKIINRKILLKLKIVPQTDRKHIVAKRYLLISIRFN